MNLRQRFTLRHGLRTRTEKPALQTSELTDLRTWLAAIAVGDQIETVERTPSQVQAIAFHVRRVIPEARYSARNVGTYTAIRRIA
jgi:hypothetical protein